MRRQFPGRGNQFQADLFFLIDSLNPRVIHQTTCLVVQNIAIYTISCIYLVALN